MSDLIRSALDFLKLAPRYLVAVAIVTGVLLFFSTESIARLGLAGFTEAYRPWLGLVFLLSSTLWTVSMVDVLSRWIRRKWARRRRYRRMIERLNNLNEDEKQILRYYIANNTRSNMLRIDNGVVQGLAAEGIIYRSASMGNMLEGFAHNISDFAWNYIHLHPEVLSGTTEEYRTHKRRELPW